MMKKVYFLPILLLIASCVFATHYRAGEIYYENLSYLTYKATVVIYTTDIYNPPDKDTISVFWGDGTFNVAQRTSQQVVGNNVKRSIYESPPHTYSGALPFYVVSIIDPNRVGGIINICGSVNIPFYVEDTLRIFNPSLIGFNNSPVLLTPPIDYANIDEVFYHNPAAFDPDGDSLTFELVPPMQGERLVVPCYRYPDQVNPGIDNNISINRFTGELIWDSPKATGVYNIAILVREYRNGILMGTLLRDMQIFVDNRNNRPPFIEKINDTCVVAGSLLLLPVIGSDPDAGQSVSLSAYGGPLELSDSPATFFAISGLNQATGTFRWQTVCNHIRRSFYQVVFKAEDNFFVPGAGIQPLSYLETWNIRVVAPAPQNLQADPQGNQINLTWNNPYNCSELATRKFIGFSVWRREGSNPFPIDTCDPGLDGKGYVKLIDRLSAYNYTDNDVQKGKQYCYRVLAEFAEVTPGGYLYNKVESLPSNEACSELKRDVPLLINVDVTETDNADGKMFVRWLKPLADNVNGLDTLQFPGPYRFELLRSEGFGVAGNFVSLISYTSNTFSELNDTIYNDSGLNTTDNPYSYRVDFYSNGGNILVGSSEIASSVFLTIAASNQRLDLSWEANVPWVNELYYVFKLNDISQQYEIIDSTENDNYADVNLKNDSTYCYFIRSEGAYSAPTLNSLTLLNNSQEKCAIPIDTIPPCPPKLIVANDCSSLSAQETCIVDESSFQNRLLWNHPLDTCDNDVKYYYLYYASPFDTLYELIEVLPASDTFYTHFLDSSIAGCYVVTAVDTAGNESERKPVCIDNCPCYILPNVFTPNQDGKNDIYTPILPYRFVDKVDMKIFNRWGNLVFETSNPMINWDGKDQKTNKEAKEGVYYYTCRVFEIRVDGVKESKEVLSGYIHLIRGR